MTEDTSRNGKFLKYFSFFFLPSWDGCGCRLLTLTLPLLIPCSTILQTPCSPTLVGMPLSAFAVNERPTRATGGAHLCHGTLLIALCSLSTGDARPRSHGGRAFLLQPWGSKCGARAAEACSGAPPHSARAPSAPSVARPRRCCSDFRHASIIRRK